MNLINIDEAAKMLGYSVKGLRKIVGRSKAKAGGARVRGPTIRFFQTTKGAPVKFKLEWIEEFVDRHTVDPLAEERRLTKRRRRGPLQIAGTSGLDEEMFDV